MVLILGPRGRIGQGVSQREHVPCLRPLYRGPKSVGLEGKGRRKRGLIFGKGFGMACLGPTFSIALASPNCLRNCGNLLHFC